ncbi:protein NRD1 [Cryptococcus gattii EJB2]|uniref:Protein NRD1 n=1 Tax=Cryptococcus gattii EJB2 TaxID=1296103 RepID=A0ABR5BXN6_9TREE|nr:protein NRD1 [Cryptococcus gattii EJB2]
MSTEQDPPAEFRPLLQDTLAAPRLSASKVTHLSRLALHNVAHDHSIVTTLYKLNAALPPASQSRISSLYVFDAIARAAKSAVNKGVGKELTNERGKGTQASLLLKLEGVVASWVDGMIDDGKGGVWVEGREKTRKIVDIWQKGSTFPQPCLDELKVKLANAMTSAGSSKYVDGAGVKKELKSSSLASGESKGSGPNSRSTTPPYPPPAYVLAKYTRKSSKNRKLADVKLEQPGQIQPGELPPEVAKLLGIDKGSPKDGKSPTSMTGIPANVAALLPSSSDPSSHSSSPHTVPSAAVASQAPTTPALTINHEQLAALAKFASNSQTRSGEHDFPPFPPPPPHPIPSAVTFHSQPYIPPPKPFSPPAAAARYPASSRDRDPRERDRYSSMSSSSSSPDKHRQNDNWRAGRQGGGGGEKRTRSRSPDRRTNGHRLNMPNRSAISSLGQGRGIVEGDGEEDMALDVSDEEERARGGPTVAQAAYPPSTVPPPYLSAPPPVAPPFPPPSSANAPQQQQQQQTPISISSSLQPTNRRDDLVTLHTFPLQTFDPSSADSWAKLGEAWQNSTGREPEQIELMHWLATGQVMDFKMMRMGMGMGMGTDMDMGMGMMDMSHENGDSSSHVSQGDMNGLSSSATAHPATGLLPASHLSMRGDQWSHTQGQAQWGNNDSWRQQGAEGQGY